MVSLMDAAQRAVKVALKEERARDAALAMREYEAEEFAVRANTARLEVVDLAREAAGRCHTKAK